MKQYHEILKKSLMFREINPQRYDALLQALNASVRHFSKHEVIFSPGKEVNETAIIVSGRAYITKTDCDGNVNIIMELEPGQQFGDALSFAKVRRSPVTIKAGSGGCSAIFIPSKNIVLECARAEGDDRIYLIESLAAFLAAKTMMLHVKNDILAQKSIRRRLMTYFYYNMIETGSAVVDIPFSREGLADYLCVNSAALSREIGKLRDEGLITYYKNRFVVTNTDFLLD